MGQMKKHNFYGVFIEVKSKNFQEKYVEDEFYDEVGYENFIYPYQGNNQINLLMPLNTRYSIPLDEDEEWIIYKIDLDQKKQLFINEKSKVIELVKKHFPEIVIRTGLVSYWDEVA